MFVADNAGSIVKRARRSGAMTAVVLALVALWTSAVVAAEPVEIGSSRLDSIINQYVAEHPDTPLEIVTAYANQLLTEHGLGFEFFMLHEPPDRTVILRSADQRFSSRTPDDVESGACGEFWASLPAIGASEDSIELIHGGRQFQVQRPEDLLLETMVVLAADQDAVINEIFVPWSHHPLYVAPDGSAVFISLNLSERANPWWRQVQKMHGFIERPYPHLILRVGKKRVEFVEDIRLYATAPAEWLDDFPNPTNDSYLFRQRFLDSSLVVQYHTPCT